MWEAFKDALFAFTEFFYNLCGDWGLAIIIGTVIFRLVLFPLVQKQTRATYQMQKFSPLMKEIQEKYADNPQRQSEETQKLYAESGFNPLAGCLPMILQMPIFIALYQMFFSMAERTDISNYCFYGILPELANSPANMFARGLGDAIPYIILLLAFALITFLPSLLQINNNQNKNQTLIMMGFMTLMMLWIGWGSPAGVLLFWAVSSIWAVAQQQIAIAVFKHKEKVAEAMDTTPKPVVIDVERKQKKKRPTKAK